MARIPGGPRGNRYSPSELTSKKLTCGCYPGQSVTVPRGLPANCSPNRITVVGEYDSIIVLKLEFDMPDDWNPEMKKTVTWNHALMKSSLLCGEAVIKDLAGRTLHPKEAEDGPRRKRGDRRQGNAGYDLIDDTQSELL